MISIENWTTFFCCMNPKRIAILEHVAARDMIASTRALSIALGRDYSSVHLRCEIEPDSAKLAAA